MNYIDLIIIGVILLSMWNGIRNGFIPGLIELITWLGSLVLCFLIFPVISNFLERFIESEVFRIIISLFATILLIRVLFSLVIDKFLVKIPFTLHEHPINRALGIIPGMINGLVYACLITAFLILFPLDERIKVKTQESFLAEKLIRQIEKLEAYVTPALTELSKGAFKKITIEPGSEKFIKLGFTVKDATPRSDLELQMLTLVNQERAKMKLALLKADPELRLVARAHAADMFSRGYFSHFTPERKDPFDRIRAAQVVFITAGENLALALTLALAHDGLMKSPGHRANILHKSFGRVGIGILDGGMHGYMIVQNFRN